jgi:hypothetical protein
MRDQFTRSIALPTLCVFECRKRLVAFLSVCLLSELHQWRMNGPHLPSAYSPQPFSSVIQFDVPDWISRLLSVWGDAEGDFICKLRTLTPDVCITAITWAQ